ncbi:GDSL esterase/lipase at4g01130 [Phtheirospermum japonicum]|uniref:GDSL esterase/lipase at4g01130 n=1 Tax=Phtheirospermum japonicum TaxID=374723 RepID=A0A830C5T4_9LAMI|nr:GDSL esterase/lipase at4g01130 [Phtheirospermum japonicum]
MVCWMVLMAMSVAKADAKCAFEAIFVFGDSNSDTGGFYAAFPSQPLPYGMTYFNKPTAFIVQFPHESSDIDSSGCLGSYNNAVNEYNSMLKDALAQARQELKDANIIYVDTYSILLDLFSNPTKHGMQHGTTACCGYGGGSYNFNQQVFCGSGKSIKVQPGTASACSDPRNYVSWDGVHFTEAASKMMAYGILSGSNFDPGFSLNQYCDIQPIG